MFEILKVPTEKFRDKMIKVAQERVTSVNAFLKRNLSFEEISNALIRGFSEAYQIELIQGCTTKFEDKLTEELGSEKVQIGQLES